MDSPARRMTRLLSGFFVTLLVVLSFYYLEGGSIFGKYWLVPVSVTITSGVLIVLIGAGGDRPHGSWITDSWISREDEVEMRSRLEMEMDEASVQDLGSKWARMEMAHLEAKHSEE
ncbi:MAG: hypothetical protein CMB67_01760 [Euryarchaeota archaeon]|nr:hypothetical protein [Euryarchaeota archaeon]|tara:strand:- start:721 stop:1068 length:348 start_codon:yes stop_codon:yes gene_type:complete